MVLVPGGATFEILLAKGNKAVGLQPGVELDVKASGSMVLMKLRRVSIVSLNHDEDDDSFARKMQSTDARENECMATKETKHHVHEHDADRQNKHNMDTARVRSVRNKNENSTIPPLPLPRRPRNERNAFCDEE